ALGNERSARFTPRRDRAARRSHRRTRRRPCTQIRHGGNNTAHIHGHHGCALLREFRHDEGEYRRRITCRHLQSRSRRRYLYASFGGETLDLPDSDLYRVLCPWSFLADLSCVVLSYCPLISIKGFNIIFIIFST